ncbi:MAG: hypothetical protein ACTSRS_22205 [Candidatus Helarchaeota archaeon]
MTERTSAVALSGFLLADNIAVRASHFFCHSRNMLLPFVGIFNQIICIIRIRRVDNLLNLIGNTFCV